MQVVLHVHSVKKYYFANHGKILRIDFSSKINIFQDGDFVGSSFQSHQNFFINAVMYINISCLFD